MPCARRRFFIPFTPPFSGEGQGLHVQPLNQRKEREMNKKVSEIRIYVACLAAYNSGILHGAWIDACQGVDNIWEDVEAMLKASPIEEAEEWAIHDYEGFAGASLSEYSSFDTVVELADFIKEVGELGGELVSYFGNVGSAKEAYNDHYAGEYNCVADFAQQITEETSNIPKNLEFYIDYERMARDLEINDVLALEVKSGEVHIFWNH